MSRMRWRPLLVSLALGLACGGDPPDALEASSPESSEPQAPDRPGPPLAPGARPELTEMLRESRTQHHDASDGGGRAWLEQAPGDPDHAVAGTPGRFTLVYEVGEHGIAAEGTISFQVSPFWGWSTPQVEAPDLPGYTTLEPSADDIELEAATLDQQLLGIRVVSRPLVGGDRIRIVFGAGPAGAIADRMAERNSRFWFGVDGDGDGTRRFLPDSPGIDVRAGAPRMLVVTLPSVARPGQTVQATIALLDGWGSRGTQFEGEISIVTSSGIEVTANVAFRSEDGGVKSVPVRADAAGVYRLHAESDSGLRGSSNPLLVSPDAPRILWGDLHGHSGLSDGTGSVDDYFLYARDVAALDVVSLTDHDHWGILPLDANPTLWSQIQERTRHFHQPGRFVTVLGYEWTSWLHGHRHVLHFEDRAELISSVDPDTESPTQLWDALRDQPALTFAHHSAGGPIGTNWHIAPDPVLEPATEIVSVHGSSEAPDSPIPIYSPSEGNFVRDVLNRGFRFGFVGSGDSHDGHPGLAQLGSPSGGLAAIMAETATRASVLDAVRTRRTYATNGPRIIVQMALGAHRMGAAIPAPGPDGVSDSLFVRVIATAPLERVDLIRSGAVVDSLAIEGELEITLQRPIEELRSGEYLYIRAVQEDSGAAWSSPIYVD
jgi:hypothetical protein